MITALIKIRSICNIPERSDDKIKPFVLVEYRECADQYTYFDGKCYYVEHAAISGYTFNGAMGICNNRAAAMLRITSEREDVFISALVG